MEKLLAQVVDLLADPQNGMKFGTVAWTSLYVLVCVLPGIKNRSFDFRPLEIGAPNTKLQTVVLSVSTSYFFYDWIACTIYNIYEGKLDQVNFWHHFFTLAGVGSGLFTQRSGAELGLCLVLMEVSNPFMHSIYLLRELGLSDTKLAAVNKALFALVFFIARMICGPYLTYYTCINKNTNIGVKAGACGIMVISLLWFQKIVNMLAKILSGSRGQAKREHSGTKKVPKKGD